MAKHWFPAFSPEKCKRCGTCLAVCPLSIIKFDETNDLIPIISNTELCSVNCFKCVKACPNDAVGIIRPAKPCDCCSF